MTHSSTQGAAMSAAPRAAAQPADTGGRGRLAMAIAAAVAILLAAAFPIYVILFTVSEGRAPVLGEPPARQGAPTETPPPQPLPFDP